MRTQVAVAVLGVLLAGGTARAQELEHFNTIEKAVEVAKKSGRDILVDFTGSDWCGWCVKLNNEVFSQKEFKSGASAKYVFVELDFPKKKEQGAEEKKYNQARQALFGVTGYPTIFVLDSEGRPYARTGYKDGGPEAYLSHLADLAGRKKEIQELRDAAAKAPNKVEALGALLERLAGWTVDAAWLDVKEEIVAADADNKAGRRLALSKELAGTFNALGNGEKFSKYLEILRGLDKGAAEGVETKAALDKEVKPLLEKQAWDEAEGKLKFFVQKGLKGEAGQQVGYFAGLIDFRQGDKEGCIKNFEAAIEMAPETKLAASMKKSVDALKKQVGR